MVEGSTIHALLRMTGGGGGRKHPKGKKVDSGYYGKFFRDFCLKKLSHFFVDW